MHLPRVCSLEDCKVHCFEEYDRIGQAGRLEMESNGYGSSRRVNINRIRRKSLEMETSESNVILTFGQIGRFN